jgi:hypothetical protein
MNTQRIPKPNNRLLTLDANRGHESAGGASVLASRHPRPHRGRGRGEGAIRCQARALVKPQCEPLCSQPISDHGVGTVRPWAAVDLTIAHRRHNVSARDGGLPASRRTGAGAFLCALLRPLPRMHLLQSCQCIHSTIHTIVRRTPLFLSPTTCLFIHGPAAAAGPASFYTSADTPLKCEITKRTHLEIRQAIV